MNGSEFSTIRRQMKLTQAELASLMGVSQPTVARWENGKLAIDVRTATTLRSLAVQRSAA